MHDGSPSLFSSTCDASRGSWACFDSGYWLRKSSALPDRFLRLSQPLVAWFFPSRGQLQRPMRSAVGHACFREDETFISAQARRAARRFPARSGRTAHVGPDRSNVGLTTFNNKGPKGQTSSPPMIRETLADILWLRQNVRSCVTRDPPVTLTVRPSLRRWASGRSRRCR